jgi:hypothetical protein
MGDRFTFSTSTLVVALLLAPPSSLTLSLKVNDVSLITDGAVKVVLAEFGLLRITDGPTI